VVAITDDHDEQALIEAAQADPARFVDLYERYFHRVYAYVVRRTRSRAEAEDITSDVFERALVNLSKFEWRGVPMVAWLFRIAANAMADRRQQIERDAGATPLSPPADQWFGDRVASVRDAMGITWYLARPA
jgi:RNA polymerase sigma factor (sigma-70 family)